MKSPSCLRRLLPCTALLLLAALHTTHAAVGGRVLAQVWNPLTPRQHLLLPADPVINPGRPVANPALNAQTPYATQKKGDAVSLNAQPLPPAAPLVLPAQSPSALR